MKLAKYLPEFGWRSTVLTGTQPTVGLPEDPGLAAQVAGIEVIRSRAPGVLAVLWRAGDAAASRPARSPVARHGAPRRGKLHPKAWLVPDSQVLWYPFAVRAALRGARAGPVGRHRRDVVPANRHSHRRHRSPHASGTVRGGLPRRLDQVRLRARRPAPLAELERRLEARMIRDAGAVVAVDARLVDHAFARLAPDDRPPLHVIQNGYDEDDFHGAMPAELPAFSIVHTGRLRRSPRSLWDALAHALRERPELRDRLHVWQVGVVDPGAVLDLQAPPEGVTVHVVPPVPQREAIGYMLGADLLLLEEFGSVMPSKALQYLRAARPLLALWTRAAWCATYFSGMPRPISWTAAMRRGRRADRRAGRGPSAGAARAGRRGGGVLPAGDRPALRRRARRGTRARWYRGPRPHVRSISALSRSSESSVATSDRGRR